MGLMLRAMPIHHNEKPSRLRTSRDGIVQDKQGGRLPYGEGGMNFTRKPDVTATSSVYRKPEVSPPPMSPTITPA